MNERAIFEAALDWETPQERSAFLDEACGGDAALRQRVEALLHSHVEAGSFLGMPVPERLLELPSTPPEDDDTAAGQPPGGEASPDVLALLTPSNKPGSLGRLGHYEILESVGHGGMGIVLKAFDDKLHRVVAIKVMPPELAAVGTARQRFIREARAAAAVSHEHVVTIHAVEEEHRPPYLVMQFVDGMSLQDKLDAKGALPLPEILRIGFQAASGLAAAHLQGVVHRDIKPANILLENGVERVKITDFGLARVADEAAVTQSGIIAGTPRYMAPEQAQGGVVDHRSDLFSLGSVLYAMCTGRAPFRGSTTVSILKRVCDEMPPPIRENNRDVPPNVVAIVEKLHAKDPAKRFQSAREVADLLEQELARLQHPAGSKFAAMPLAASPARLSFRRWAVAAATVVVLLAAAMALSEGLGITRLVAMLRGDSQTSDRHVGNVDAQGVKDVSAGTLQPLAAPASTNPFVVLGGDRKERQFATLAEAVGSASDGDTIEVRGNGPFVTETVSITAALTIRAGDGFRPVINLSGKAAQNDQSLFDSSNRLVLEGLEFFRPKGSKTGTMVTCSSGPLVAAANCRFRMEGVGHCIWTPDSAMTRNCVFLGGEAFATISAIPNGAKYIMENCVDIGTPVALHSRADANKVTIRLTHNTILANGIGIQVGELSDVLPGAKGPKPVRFDVSGNIFGSDLLWVRPTPDFLAKRKGFDPEKSGEAHLRSLMDWDEHENLHAPGSACLTWVMVQDVQPPKRIKTLTEWQQLWGLAGTGSVEGRAKYEGGDVLARFAAAPNQLTPDDFRLRADSPGYRAGADGKDLGADVDLVGPGAAYERWKKTPEYQQWLKDTGQLSAETAQPETGAFALIGGQGVAERKFDTLAEAVQSASDGDTIEIRGNGPFVTEPVNLGKKVLTIRAATGFQPIIKGNADSTAEGDFKLLQCQGPLVLEGLELQMTGPFDSTIVHSSLAPVHIANCRFALNGGVSLWTGDSPLCTVRNCQFVAKPTGYLQIPIVSHLPNNAKLILENNLLSGPCHHALELVWRRPDLHNVAVHLNHNTVATLRVAIVQGIMSLPESAEAGAAPDRQAVQMHVSSNLFFESMNSSERMLALLLPPDWYDHDVKPLTPTEAEGLLPRLMAWREERNLYSSGLSFQSMRRVKEPTTPEREFIDEPLAAYQTFADWQRMWKTGDSGSAEGVIRYEGGDVLTKMGATPEQITPADFRLRPDSAGYRAGKDGKDLGADVDLVGPGAAYERWKKTPDYQQWLKDTGQEK